jgi:hypothetical protein
VHENKLSRFWQYVKDRTAKGHCDHGLTDRGDRLACAIAMGCARRGRLVGVESTVSFGARTAARLLDCSVAEAGAVLDELVAVGLIEVRAEEAPDLREGRVVAWIGPSL